jgi:hypothetical protein
VTPAGGQFSIVGWRGRPPESYVDRFRIIGPSATTMGDSVILAIFGADRDGNTRLPDSVAVRVSDDRVAQVFRLAGHGTQRSYLVRPRANGSTQITASIPGWRVDTMTLRVGRTGPAGVSDDFAAGIAERWIALGSPRPVTRFVDGVPSLFPNADLQWQSGLLSRTIVSLAGPVDISATFSGPFAGRPIAGASLTLALVEDRADMDSVAPQTNAFVGISWDGEASRFTYSVGPQSKSDPVSVIGGDKAHAMRIVLGPGDQVTFFIDNRARWTSSLRFLGTNAERRARIWLGGKATGDWGSIRDFVSKP